MLRPLSFTFLLVLVIGPVAAQSAWDGPYLAADVNSLDTGSHPGHFVRFGESVYFRAGGSTTGRIYATDGTPGGSREELLFTYDDGIHGEELWVTEGDSTRLFADVYPGPTGSRPRSAVRVGDPLFVSATVPVFGTELVVFRHATADPSPEVPSPEPASYVE